MVMSTRCSPLGYIMSAGAFAAVFAALAVTRAGAESRRPVVLSEVLARAQTVVRAECVQRDEGPAAYAAYATMRYVFRTSEPALFGDPAADLFRIKFEVYRYLAPPLDFIPGEDYVLALGAAAGAPIEEGAGLTTYRLAAGRSGVFPIRKSPAGAETVTSEGVVLGPIPAKDTESPAAMLRVPSPETNAVDYRRFKSLVSATRRGVAP